MFLRSLLRERVTVYLPDGNSFDVIFKSNKTYQAARRFTNFEPEFLDEFIINLQRCRVFYDVGSYIGLYSLSALSYREDAIVVAIDPDPLNCRTLERNIRCNKFDNRSDVICVALSDADGSIQFSFSGEYGGSSGHVKRLSDPDSRKSVPIYKLDTLIQKNRLPPPELIKIDVEGYEAHVLRGMEETIGNFSPIIMVEVHPQFLENYGESASAIDSFFEAKGYLKKTLHVPGPNSKTKHRQYHISYFPNKIP